MDVDIQEYKLLIEKYSKLQSDNEQLKARVKELESDLSFTADKVQEQNKLIEKLENKG